MRNDPLREDEVIWQGIAPVGPIVVQTAGKGAQLRRQGEKITGRIWSISAIVIVGHYLPPSWV